eukprot:gene31693-39935_t
MHALLCENQTSTNVMLAAQSGSGSRAVALLLDRMGIFMATGPLECRFGATATRLAPGDDDDDDDDVGTPQSACFRSESDTD